MNLQYGFELVSWEEYCQVLENLLVSLNTPKMYWKRIENNIRIEDIKVQPLLYSQFTLLFSNIYFHRSTNTQRNGFFCDEERCIVNIYFDQDPLYEFWSEDDLFLKCKDEAESYEMSVTTIRVCNITPRMPRSYLGKILHTPTKLWEMDEMGGNNNQTSVFDSPTTVP